VVELNRAAVVAMRDRLLAGMNSIDTKDSFLKKGRGDRTAIELFPRGVRLLASQLSTAEAALVAILNSSCSDPFWSE
jgi:hypothetical protein